MIQNMHTWIAMQKTAEKKKAMPILSFPCIQLLETPVRALISSSDLQAKGMYRIAQRCNSAAAVSMMDLSVEAEAFGASVQFSDDEVPTVRGQLIADLQDAQNLAVPAPGTGRTGIYIEAMQKAASMISDRPVFAGIIGPFSLAGRLMDMTEIMVNCYVEPDLVKLVLEKCTSFLTAYMREFVKAGANGVIIAEPAAGLLSPELNAEFSVPYVRQMTHACASETFSVIYHNCGNVVPLLADILTIGADAYHFGNAVDMEEVAGLLPEDILFMGNIDPAGEFRNGTPESIRAKTEALLQICGKKPNFLISSGCDIPPLSSWDNIQAFFDTVAEYYEN